MPCWLLVDDPILLDVHPQRDWASLVRYERFTLVELLSYFNLRRQTLLQVLGDLPDLGWERTASRASNRTESIYRLARTLALHERDHLQDIRSKLDIRTSN